jgi:hypothetical protein
MTLPPIHHEYVVEQTVLTLQDASTNADKVYVLEVLYDSGYYRLRARYGRNDGRKLRLHDYGMFSNRWSASVRRDELRGNKTHSGYLFADALAGLCLLTADNQRQRIEQIQADYAGQPLEVA